MNIARITIIIHALNKGRLRDKIILLFIVLSTTPVIILGGMTLYLLDLSHKQDVSQLELQLLRQKSEEIEKFFIDTLGILELQVSFEQTSEIAKEDQLFLLENFLLENEAFEEVSFINLKGEETACRIRIASDKMEPKELSYVARLPKFKVASKGGKYVGNVYHTLSGPFVTVAMPVKNRGGTVIQVLAAEVNLSHVKRLIENAYIGVSGYVVLVDKNSSLIVGGNQAIPIPGASFRGWSRMAQVLTGTRFDGLGVRDRYISPLSKVPVVGAGEGVGDTGWGLLVEWPLSDANAIIDEVRSQIILLTLAGIFAVLLLAPLFASRLVQPIYALMRSARAIEKGEFEKQVSIDTGDELEELGIAFNQMRGGLKRLQELKDEFVFVAAHELKAPVSVIKGYVSMIMEGDAGAVPGKVKTFLTQVDRANQNLLNLVGNLLQVARSEAGRIEMKVSPVSISRVTKEVVNGFTLQAKNKSISLTYDVGKSAPGVHADPDALKEVMTNLVSNAIKYTLEGGLVTVFHEVKDGELLTHVKDTGLGISKEAQQKLFEKFYRVKSKGTEQVEGTGLGLWIVRELIRRMGGKIWVSSEEGRGSTFSFSLPLVS